MAQTNVNIRMDEDLKKQFEAFCSDVGMSMTTAFCVFAKATVRQHKIPFEISEKKILYVNEDTAKALGIDINNPAFAGATVVKTKN